MERNATSSMIGVRTAFAGETCKVAWLPAGGVLRSNARPLLAGSLRLRARRGTDRGHANTLMATVLKVPLPLCRHCDSASTLWLSNDRNAHHFHSDALSRCRCSGRSDRHDQIPQRPYPQDPNLGKDAWRGTQPAGQRKHQCRRLVPLPPRTIFRPAAPLTVRAAHHHASAGTCRPEEHAERRRALALPSIEPLAVGAERSAWSAALQPTTLK